MLADVPPGSVNYLCPTLAINLFAIDVVNEELHIASTLLLPCSVHLEFMNYIVVYHTFDFVFSVAANFV